MADQPIQQVVLDGKQGSSDWGTDADLVVDGDC
jgi:hypothetical protein